MEELTKNLQEIGLSPEEIMVYTIALESGAESILHIAQKTQIPRTTVYLIIESLVKKGLIVESAQGKKKKFVPASPKDILKYAKQKQQQLADTIENLQKELPQFHALYSLKHEKPKLRYYEGIEGVKKVYEDTLNAEEILVQCMSQQAIPLMGEYLDKYFVRLIRRMIHTKEIVSDSAADKDYQKKYSTSRNTIICIPQKYSTNTDYMIYGDTVGFITYKDNAPVGIVIEDKEIAHFEKIRFNLLWELLQTNTQH